MTTIDYDSQATEIHDYIVKEIGHNWRLPTWKKKYLARLKKYGFDKCILAIDGFRVQSWWMEHKSQDAPDVIFRSDKSFERFLVVGEKLREQQETRDQKTRKEERETQDRETHLSSIREKLERDNADLTARMQRKLETLRDQLQELSFSLYIAPLLYVSFIDGIITVFHENASWVQEHYQPRLERVLGVPVVVTDDPAGVI